MENTDERAAPMGQAHNERPAFTFYPQFADDWEGSSSSVKRAVGKFLEVLQEKYDDPESQRDWDLNGKYWGALLPEIDYRIIWRVVPETREIHILAVEPIPGAGRPSRSEAVSEKKAPGA
jgi:hypothetical protein